MPDYVLPDYLDGDALDIQWKLYEFGGHFYRGRPKDGSIRPADLPPFLAELLTWHKTQIKGRRCTCRKFDEATGPASGTTWCTGAEYMFLSPGGSHYRRVHIRRTLLSPGRGRLVSRTGAPVRAARPDRHERAVSRAASRGVARCRPGEEFVPPTGRGVSRFVSDPATARCAVCRRAFPRRLDGLVISHKSNGDRCPGSGQVPGEDLAVASWAPLIKGLTPHGKRHGLKVWMDEDQIADVLKSERLGHDEPGMRGVYGHVSPAMRRRPEGRAASPLGGVATSARRAIASCPRCRCLTDCWPVSGPLASPFAPVWLPKSDIGRGGTRTAGHQMLSDLRFHGSGWGDLNSRPLRPERSALPSCATPRRQHRTTVPGEPSLV